MVVTNGKRSMLCGRLKGLMTRFEGLEDAYVGEKS